MRREGLGAEEEGELIARSRKGELAAFNALVESYQGQVYNMALRLLGDPDAAADATQEAFISAYRNLGSFRGASFRAWLLRIAANACYDQLRRVKRHPTVPLDTATLESRAPSPEAHALRRELAETIQQGLDRLPVEQRLVVVLCDVQGLSYEEAALITRASLGTVKSRLSRGRARLRDYLRPYRELLP